MKKFLPIYLAFLLPWTFSCERLLIKEDPSTDTVALFDEAWTFADQNYAFFEYKNIDWDVVYDTMRPKVVSGLNTFVFFDVLDEMLFTLRDGHVNLSTPFNLSRNWEWYLNSPENFNYSLLERNYFNGEQEYVGPFVAMDFGDVGYCYYSSFSRGVSSRSIDYILARFWNHKGLIIDMRNNGGGSLTNADKIVSRFVTESTTVAYQEVKNGPGHEDFSEPEAIIIEPEGPRQYTKPVILLVNRKSYSATNTCTLYLSGLPQVTVMGDTTGGGGGAPATTQLANGWSIRVSSTRLLSPDGFNVENGIPPDVRANLTPLDESRGIDTILELALRRLR